jgi:hypothetical protein
MLTIEGAHESHTAEMWSDSRMPPELPHTGDEVQLPVKIRTFVQGGTAKHTLIFGSSQQGEEF